MRVFGRRFLFLGGREYPFLCFPNVKHPILISEFILISKIDWIDNFNRSESQSGENRKRLGVLDPKAIPRAGFGWELAEVVKVNSFFVAAPELNQNGVIASCAFVGNRNHLVIDYRMRFHLLQSPGLAILFGRGDELRVCSRPIF